MNVVHRSNVIRESGPRAAIILDMLSQSGVDEYDSIDAASFLMIGIFIATKEGLPKDEIEAFVKQALYGC